MVPDRHKKKSILFEKGVGDNWCRRGRICTGRVQPTSVERNEWKKLKKRKEDGTTRYHHREREKDMVREEKGRAGGETRAGIVIKRSGAWRCEDVGCDDDPTRTPSGRFFRAGEPSGFETPSPRESTQRRARARAKVCVTRYPGMHHEGSGRRSEEETGRLPAPRS